MTLKFVPPEPPINFKPPLNSTHIDQVNGAVHTGEGDLNIQPNAMWQSGFDAGSEASKAFVDVANERAARWQAEFENLQRRTAKEVVEAQRQVENDFLQELLPVIDSIEMAIASAQSKDAGADPLFQSLLQGIQISRSEFTKVLSKHEIESYDPKGTAFNPAEHEAIMQQEAKDVPPMTILMTFLKGYRQRERVLRAAKVSVSSGGQRATEPLAE